MTKRSRRSAHPPRRALKELARRLGIISEYRDQTGRRTVHTSDATREALLAVMGFDSPTDAAAQGWLAELDAERGGEIIAPVRVLERDDPSARNVRVRLPRGFTQAKVELRLDEETGQSWRVTAEIRRSGTVRLPTRAPYGYHRLSVQARSSGREIAAEQSFIVTPSACVTPASLIRGDARRMGVVANLYSVRRDGDWGIGDLETLARLVEWSADRQAAFVGVNPLHALVNRGVHISPYAPVSRLFRNAIYIDVESVPELESHAAARAMMADAAFRRGLDGARAASHIDYDGVIDLKLRVLAELHRAFRERRGSGSRARDYDDFVRAREPELTGFATWMAIAESAGLPDWRAWPESYRDPGSNDVKRYAETNAERVDFHRWLQFELARQLAGVAARARSLGMEIGVYQDLAIGTSKGGSDTWSFQPDRLFLDGASVGAPPDPYALHGQNWGLPPMDPRALRRQAYRYWIQLVRRSFEHAGALRIDHVMGLFRSFWIPDGGQGEDGAYVRFPAHDLLRILCLESVRNDALVVGEDLGTVPREVPPALRKRGILSSKVLYFERGRAGLKPASRYPALALATANTHDLPTLGAFWTGSDIELRASTGLLPSAAAVRAARRARAAERKQLLARLRLPWPPNYEEERFPRRLARSVHDFLCSTRAALVGVSLDDLLGETVPVNLPGVGPDGYPSWRRRSRMTLDEASWSFEVDETVGCASRRNEMERK